MMPKAGARHLGVDPIGVKVAGEGAWKTRQHGVSQRRTWRKLHLGVDEATGEIGAMVVSTNDVADSPVLADLLEQIEDAIEQVSTDGADDHRHCDDEIAAKGAKPVMPPRKDAKIWQHGNRKGKGISSASVMKKTDGSGEFG